MIWWAGHMAQSMAAAVADFGGPGPIWVEEEIGAGRNLGEDRRPLGPLGARCSEKRLFNRLMYRYLAASS